MLSYSRQLQLFILTNAIQILYAFQNDHCKLYTNACVFRAQINHIGFSIQYKYSKRHTTKYSGALPSNQLSKRKPEPFISLLCQHFTASQRIQICRVLYLVCIIRVLQTVVFTLNRSFYPATSAVLPVSFLILHPRDSNSVVTVRQRKTLHPREIQIPWSQTERQRTTKRR